MMFRRASVVVSLLAASGALAGDLNPPAGPVAPTMKNLQEVEPRTAINATNTPGDADSIFRITQPGSYYLAGNVSGVAAKRGIEIVASNVTIDLNGFSLTGVAASLDGVTAIGGQRNITLKNGTFRSWAADGVDLSDTANSTVIGVAASENTGIGILTGGNALVSGCNSISNGSDNIRVGGFSKVENCLANSSTGGYGINASFIHSIVAGCTANGNSLSGIRASQRTLVQDCVCSYNTLHGVHTTYVGVVENCFINYNGGDGILMDAGGLVTIRNNTISESSGPGDAGIRITNNSSCHVEGNDVVFCNIGLAVASGGNTVARNSVRDNTDNYNFASGNQLSLLLAQIPETIDWPAEVTLSGALTGSNGSSGVTINSDDVTLDLGGHALVGVAGALDGVTVSGSRRNITVKNGSVRAWPGDGVDLVNAFNCSVKDVSSSTNTGVGILTGNSGLVSGCNANANGSDNIRIGGYSKVENCIANSSTGGHGVNAPSIQSIVAGCTANGNAMSGIKAAQRTLVQNCVCSNNTLHGVHITFGGVVENCFMNQNAGDGVLMDAGGVVTIRNNTISESNGAGDAGIRVTTNSGCHIEGNSVTVCNTGYVVSSTVNVVVRNTAIANGTNYSIVAGNTAGPIVTPGTAAAATNPLANYSH